VDEFPPPLESLREAMQPTWTQERSQHLYRGLARRNRRQLARRVGAWSAIGAVACVLAWQINPASSKGPAPVASKLRPIEPRAEEVAPQPRAAEHAPSLASQEAEREIALADGSNARVRAASDLLVLRDEPAHIELSLERGSAEFDVVPNKQREFTVRAGPVRVAVLGTVFTVEREDDRVRVSVTRGKVRVSSAARIALVRAGDSKTFEARSARAARTAAREDPRATWRSLNKGGDYEGAYRLIAAGAAVPDDAEALMDAADAARFSDHPRAALGFLRKVTSNHQRSPAAPLAAFMSGQLLERMAEPLEAANAFRMARELAPTGSLAEDALAREVEAWSKAGRADEASRSVRRYEEQYPGGRWLRVVQQHGRTQRR
jgi:transmembrane sensor